MKAHVVKDYQSDYTAPWTMTEGERLLIGERDSEWDGWLWCTNAEGESRWVPESFLERRGDKCIALRDYEATELNVKVGEVVWMGVVESGWAWCIMSTNQTDQPSQQGWLPLACLDVARENKL